MKTSSKVRLAAIMTLAAMAISQSGANAAAPPAETPGTAITHAAYSLGTIGPTVTAAELQTQTFVKVAANRTVRFKRAASPRLKTATVRRTRQPSSFSVRTHRQQADTTHKGWINLESVSGAIHRPTTPPPSPPPQHDDDCMSCD